MKPIYTFDVETDPFKVGRSPRPFLAGFFDGKTTRVFHGDDCCARAYREMRKTGGYIYAHNGGKFDFRYLMQYLRKDRAKLKPIKGRAARFVLENGTEFRDSYCILPAKLRDLGAKGEIEYWKLEKEIRAQYMDEIVAYWKTDLRVLWERVNQFVETHGFGMTLAGRTFATFKKDFDLDPPKADQFYDRAFRPYYYGGRTQFFELGCIEGNFKLVDINSAYPAAMLKEHAFALQWKDLERLPNTKESIERCFIRFVGSCAGGLPHREQDKSLSFGPYEGEFFVTGWEFYAALELGLIAIDRMVQIQSPLKCRSFEKFVNHFFRQKRMSAKGSADEVFAKLFMNSGYGRFAMNPEEFRDVEMTAYRVEPEGNVLLRKQIAKMVMNKHPGIRGESFKLKCADYWEASPSKWVLANDFEDSDISIWERQTVVRSDSYYNVATAASITGCVRAFMLRSLATVKRPIYCDTDSIICEDAKGLTIGSGLGEWKLECEFEKDCVYIAGKKLYAALKLGKDSKDTKSWKLASKGVRLSPQEIIRVAKGETVKSTLEAPTFSIYTTHTIGGSVADFVTRTTRRDDLRRNKN